MNKTFLEWLVKPETTTVMAEPKIQGGKSYFLTNLFLYQGPIIDGQIPGKEEQDETRQTTETI